MARIGKSVALAQPIAEVVGDMRLHTEAWWAARDAEVARQRAQEQAVGQAKADELRAELLRRRGTPRRALRCALAGPRPNPAMGAVGRFARSRSAGVLVLSGGKGCGKTVAAVWWLLRHGGATPGFVRAAKLEAVGRYDTEFRALWEGASALVLDDLGEEWADRGGHLLVILDEIIDVSYADCRPLVITSNLDKAPFCVRYGARIESRIRECHGEGGGWAPVSGPDLRGATK